MPGDRGDQTRERRDFERLGEELGLLLTAPGHIDVGLGRHGSGSPRPGAPRGVRFLSGERGAELAEQARLHQLAEAGHCQLEARVTLGSLASPWPR